jgi:hypothetical protein
LPLDDPAIESPIVAASGPDPSGRCANIRLCRPSKKSPTSPPRVCPDREIASALGIAKSTVAYHLRTLGKAVDERCNRRYDWEAVQAYYDAGNSISQCQRHFGFSRETFNAAPAGGRSKVGTRGNCSRILTG